MTKLLIDECLNGPVGMDLALQKELFSEALDELDVNGDLTNQVLEVTLEENETSIQIERYSHPRPGEPEIR